MRDLNKMTWDAPPLPTGRLSDPEAVEKLFEAAANAKQPTEEAAKAKELKGEEVTAKARSPTKSGVSPVYMPSIKNNNKSHSKSPSVPLVKFEY